MSSASGNSWPVLGSESGGGECCAEVDVCACRRRCRRCRRSHCDTSARRTEARTDKGRCDQTGSVGGTDPDSNTTGWDPRSATSSPSCEWMRIHAPSPALTLLRASHGVVSVPLVGAGARYLYTVLQCRSLCELNKNRSSSKSECVAMGVRVSGQMRYCMYTSETQAQNKRRIQRNIFAVTVAINQL
jgi:hypothetical protein